MCAKHGTNSKREEDKRKLTDRIGTRLRQRRKAGEMRMPGRGDYREVLCQKATSELIDFPQSIGYPVGWASVNFLMAF